MPDAHSQKILQRETGAGNGLHADKLEKLGFLTLSAICSSVGARTPSGKPSISASFSTVMSPETMGMRSYFLERGRKPG